MRTGATRPNISSVDDIMNAGVVTIRPDFSLRTALELMLDYDVSGLPVVDDDGRLVGLISRSDLLRSWRSAHVSAIPFPLPGAQELPASRVDDVMVRPVLTVLEGTSLYEAGLRMARAGVHRLPVVSESGKLVGIVSSTDFVRWLSLP